jgi:polyisoprenoid-binding protein YceI
MNVHSTAAGIIALACAVLTQPAAHGAALTVLYDKSRISCISRQEKVPVEAQFRKFTAHITFDPARPEAASAQIEIDLDSFDIGFPEYNEDAKGKNWFDARNFPRAKFVSTGMRALGGGRYETRGPLTIKGKTNDVVAPFTYKSEAGVGIFEGAFSIKRLQYNIGDGVWRETDTVADDVQIKFRIVVATVPAAVKK